MDNKELRSAIRSGKRERVIELISSRDLGCPSESVDGQSLLCHAIEAGQKDIVKLLLDNGAKVDIQSEEEARSIDPPLIIAVGKRDTEIVDMLLDRGANIKVKNRLGSTPLCEAITFGDINMVRLLLDRNADIYGTYFAYSSALDHASKCENPEIIELLISRGAKMGFDNRPSDVNRNLEDEDSFNLLHVTIERGYVSLLEQYLKRGSDVNSTGNIKQKSGYTLLHFACERYKKEILEVLLRYGADVNAKAVGNLAPLHIAVKGEKADFVELLLYHGANVDAHNDHGNTALLLAAANGDSRTVKIILKYRPDINDYSNKSSLRAAVCGHRPGNRKDIILDLILYGFTARTETSDIVLHKAIRNGYLVYIDDFLRGVDVNSTYTDSSREMTGYTLLHMACENDKVEVVEHLIKKGADINARTEFDLTPLLVAAKHECRAVARLLLDLGANVDDEDKEGNTALCYAAEDGLLTIVKLILQYRPRVNREMKKNPLFSAVMCEKAKRDIIIESLFDYGFTVNSKDADDYRFLYKAAVKGEVRIMKDLLKFVTEDHLSCYRHRTQSTPLHHAAMNIQKEIIQLLLEYGADLNGGDCKGATPIYSLIYGTTRFIKNNMLKENSNQLGEIQQKCLEILDIFLQHGVNPKTGASGGSTLLHYTASCYTGMIDIARLLLRKGVDVNIVDSEGKTPLSIATYSGNRDLARLFLEHGGFDFSRTTDRNVLGYASREGYSEYFSIPLKHHLADLNSADEHGITTLQFAQQNVYEELVSSLLEYGVDINTGNHGWLNNINKHSLLKTHILKLNIAGLKVPVDSLSHKASADLTKKCRKELEQMKNRKIGNTTVSFRDILTDDVDQLAAYAENESISSLETSEYENLFPVYSSVIRGFLWRGIIRRELVKKGKDILRCYGILELPDVCVKAILKHLTDQDLRVLIRNHQK